jgi:hypothetical protein
MTIFSNSLSSNLIEFAYFLNAPISFAETLPLLLPSAMSLAIIVTADANFSCAFFSSLAAPLLGRILSGAI